MAQAMGNKAATDAQFHYRYPTPKSPARKQHGMMGSLSDKLHWAACMILQTKYFRIGRRANNHSPVHWGI